MNNSAPLLWNCGGQQERGSWVVNADFCYSQVKAILLWKLGVANQNLPQGALSVRHTTPSALTPFIQMRTTSPEESSFNKEKNLGQSHRGKKTEDVTGTDPDPGGQSSSFRCCPQRWIWDDSLPAQGRSTGHSNTGQTVHCSHREEKQTKSDNHIQTR